LLNATPGRHDGKFVLYWMVASRRTRFNFGLQHAVGLRHLLGRIAQDRIIELEGLGELPVGLRIIDAGGEVLDVELADPVPTLTERAALFGSASGERLGKPGEDHGALAHVVAQAVCLAVGAGEREIRGELPHTRFALGCGHLVSP
jgi:hypothetical protein